MFDDGTSYVPRQTWKDVTDSLPTDLDLNKHNISLCLIKKWFTALSECQSNQTIIDTAADYRSKPDFLLSIPC